MAVVGRGAAIAQLIPAPSGGRSVNLRCVEPTRLLARVGSRGSHASRRPRVRAGARRVRASFHASTRPSRVLVPTIVEGTTAWNRRSASFAVFGRAGATPRAWCSIRRGSALAGLPAEGRAFIVIVRDSRKLDSQRPRPAGWMGGRLQGSYHYSVTPPSPTCAAFCSFHTGAVLSAGVYAAHLARRQEPAGRRRRSPGVDFFCPRVRRAGVDDSDCRHPCRRVHG